MSATATFASLNGIPSIDLAANLEHASRHTKRGFASLVSEVFALRWGPGKLTSNEYFYYRLWETGRSLDAKRAFMGKQAQERMHRACNDIGCLPLAADKLVFQSSMSGAGFVVPKLLAVVHTSRTVMGARALRTEKQVRAFLDDPAAYPLFAKPIEGKYSLGVISLDALLPGTGVLVGHDGEMFTSVEIARRLIDDPAGFLIQGRLSPAAVLECSFGPRMWSVRVLLLLTDSGPVIHRATAKIPTGANPADNFWRPGNMVGAIDLASGRITRVVRGSGAAMMANEVHPDTGQPIVGVLLPGWECLKTLVNSASSLFPGIRTQSWDIALSAGGPIPLELNWGGDLNLAQLASGVGVLDDAYRDHLRSCAERT